MPGLGASLLSSRWSIFLLTILLDFSGPAGGFRKNPGISQATISRTLDEVYSVNLARAGSMLHTFLIDHQNLANDLLKAGLTRDEFIKVSYNR